jgi:F-type H+-transporting ATPase subunit b
MKFFLKIFIFVLLLSEAYAEGQKSAGLPQMDISTFPSQLFWLIVTFTALYLFMWKFVIPRLSTTIEERKDKISNDINDAENLNRKGTAEPRMKKLLRKRTER